MPGATNDTAYFVTNDNRMRDGVMDPDDIAIVKDMMIVTAEEAMRLAKEDAAEGSEGRTGGSAEGDDDLPPDAIRLTPEQMEEVAAHAAETMKVFDTIAEAIVRRMDMAPFVRQQRIEQKKSWRAISRAVHDEVLHRGKLGGPLWEPITNQLMGMTLCKIAAEIADQDYMEPPWN